MSDLQLTTEHPSQRNQLARIVGAIAPTFRYWMETEVHVYAFSIAANVLLSFFPFLIVMISICRYLLHWQGAEQAMMSAVTDFFPGTVGDFVNRNISATVSRNGPLQFVSIFLLFFTANGIFEPLEVALNRAWGITTNRSFLRNQLVSLGLIFAVGALVMLSAVLSGTPDAGLVRQVVFKTLSVPVTILILLLVYWLLPNKRLNWRRLLPVSFVVGLALELLKFINVLTLPWLWNKLDHEYGPFKNSVAIVLWSFLASMIVLAGAEWSARASMPAPSSSPQPPSGPPEP